ncbi:hypothetical protein HYH03_002448 [Edaphochlamys debaryana]|uniref:Uncharacterized protein n=1 Tax=Edaphochlamys debaryana TaxID=47281 RepID=A0A835YBC9_9CHLO|nr:hypothetical protein HYH03_002448 [Edaphochlamys debaryana]|eukprot:KAG2499501.1 hypothetical protein HYH03_002448 [Edaphochlamys debaryana]
MSAAPESTHSTVSLAPRPQPLVASAPAPPPAAASAPVPAPVLLNPLRVPMPLVLASTGSGVGAVAGEVVEEVEEVVGEVFHFFQHGAEALGHTVHHLQVVHALERLENMPLDQVVDLAQLKAALHPVVAATPSDGAGAGEGAGAYLSEEGWAAARELDAALDGVAGWRLREVVDTGRLAEALEDVPVSGSLNQRTLQREAGRIRRTLHWQALAEAVRPEPLRRALEALGGGKGSPFSELDIRAAVAALRMDVVQRALAPAPPPAAAKHSLEAGGMWTWEM